MGGHDRYHGKMENNVRRTRSRKPPPTKVCIPNVKNLSTSVKDEDKEREKKEKRRKRNYCIVILIKFFR